MSPKTLIFLLFMSLYSNAFGQAQSIRIGELNSYKVFPAFLEPYKKGWELALEEINRGGGVNGRKLEVISRDDGGTPGDAVRVAEELISREQAALLIHEHRFRAAADPALGVDDAVPGDAALRKRA